MLKSLDGLSVPRLARNIVAQLLSFPLFYKVLVANSILMMMGAIIGTALAQQLEASSGNRNNWVGLLFAFIGVILTVALNTLILRAALQPLRALRETVASLDKGDFSARVPQSPLADADLAIVSDTLNQILNHLQRYQERVQDLSAGVLRAQEDERHRIARELHDQIGQSLTLLLVRLKLIEALPQSHALDSEISDLRKGVADTIDQVRRLALDLRPPALDQLGLVPALRTLAREFEEQMHIDVQCEFSNEAITTTPERATAIYRIVQEALTNIAKHAEAHSVRIIFTCKPRALTITIHDDGHGFEPASIGHTDSTRDGPGLGLFGMEERARLLGGNCTIRSRFERGTIVTATIPINPLETIHGNSNNTTDQYHSIGYHPYPVSR
jgi:two-component system sensor histidine kinase UhpB